MRSQVSKSFTLSEEFKEKLLTWSSQFYEVVWLDSNNYEQEHSNFKALLAVDALTSIQTTYQGAFDTLQEYQKTTKDWLFGYLTYDLKNDVEQLTSVNEDHLGFSDICFFQPKKILIFDDTTVTFNYLNFVEDEIDNDWEAINNQVLETPGSNSEEIKIRLRTSKDSYFKKVEKILNHIDRGDIYEANFCQEFFSENTRINPVTTFLQLNGISKPPFATFLKINNRYLLSASPERYLKKEGDTVISQPIKGTAKRAKSKEKDNAIINRLLNDPKERSENIMITDLVRNDLSRFAKKGSVKVDELCKVYTFEQVHQLISTIRCEVDPSVSIVSLIRDTFPMGSMTGAPKVSAMKIIEKLEDAKRGLYSGAVGYFTPDNNFDFNVIIRSILYNETNKYVSFSVGGAIINKSSPEAEYEECLLKAKAMRSVLE
jgi:para-aminobenzoate synthetase component 1